MPDVITLGEALIDFVADQRGVTVDQAVTFKKAAGGAPFNVAVGCARLGLEAGFMGKVGRDPFGHYLRDVLQREGVDHSQLKFSAQARTGLAFVAVDDHGEREFSFFRHPSADILHRPEEVREAYLAQARLLHVGSISAIQDPSRSATYRALEMARKHGLWISFDPNLRLSLWHDQASARQEIRRMWPYAQLIKLSLDELAFLAELDHLPGEHAADIERAARSLWHENLQLMALTLGKDGCGMLTEKEFISCPGFQVNALDSTGAGDGFTAGLLTGVLQQGLAEGADLSRSTVKALGRYANAVGALTTTQQGVVPALPHSAEVQAFLADG